MAVNPSNTLQGTASTLCTDRRRRRVARERASEHLVKRTDSTFSAPSFLPLFLPALLCYLHYSLARFIGVACYTQRSRCRFSTGTTPLAGFTVPFLRTQNRPLPLLRRHRDRSATLFLVLLVHRDGSGENKGEREESSWVERAAVSSRKYWTGNNCGQRCTDISERGRGC